MITGFQARMQVNDGEAGAFAYLVGLTTFNLPKLTAGKFDATELDQDDGGTPTPAADPYEREEPTGTIKVGDTNAEIKYTKANYQRLQALVGVRGKQFKLFTPDDLSDDTPVKLTCQFTGFVSEVGDVKFEKGSPVSIPFVLTCSRKPAYS